ncbi:MAG: HEAT repeat domain-containing protein [Blastocatellia bacterium]
MHTRKSYKSQSQPRRDRPVIFLYAILLIAGLSATPLRKSFTDVMEGGAQGASSRNGGAKATAAPPAELFQWFNEGRTFIAIRDWAKAGDAFNKIIVKYPNAEQIDSALYWLAYALKNQGKFQEADRVLERLIKEFPASTWANDAKAMRVEIAPGVGKTADLVKEAKFGATDDIRIVALQGLLAADPQQALALLLDVLNPQSKASKHVKEASVTLLGNIDSQQATSALINIARNEPDARLRTKALMGLERADDESALGLLKEAAVTSDDPQVTMAALYSISQHGGQGGTELLSEIARTARSAKARQQAVTWLTRRQGDNITDQLINIYHANQDVEVKKEVLTSLGQIDNQRAVDFIARSIENTEDMGVRRHAVFQLAPRHIDRAAEALAQWYDLEKQEEVKGEILSALGQSKQKQALKKLIAVAKNDPSPGMRQKAISLIGGSDDPEALQFLRELTNK